MHILGARVDKYANLLNFWAFWRWGLERSHAHGTRGQWAYLVELFKLHRLVVSGYAVLGVDFEKIELESCSPRRA